MEKTEEIPVKATTCPKCYDEVEPGLKFCTKCGTEIKHTVSADQATTCPKCYDEVEPGLRFCTGCGTEIKRTVSVDQATTCPKCYADVPPGTTFCTECGTSIKVTNVSNAARNNPVKGDTVDNVVESGKGLMKGLGGFLNKAAESIDKNIEKTRQGQYTSAKENNHNLMETPGYLVCDECGGYYELQQGESADDFSDECDCGGNLEHKLRL
ncbi:Double zinc ribbon [anaerobic digester metagenome]